MQIKSIDPITLKKRLDDGNAILIDVREPHEHAREHIEGALLVPLSRFDAEDFGELRNKTAVFHCRTGGRTTANAHARALRIVDGPDEVHRNQIGQIELRKYN